MGLNAHLVVMIVSWVLGDLDAIGDSIEINLRQQMGEQRLSLLPEPDQNWGLL